MEFIEESLPTDKEKAMVHFNGITENFSKVNGKMARKMDLELGSRPRETFMKANGE